MGCCMFFHIGLFEDASLGVHDFALMAEYRDGSSAKVALYNMDDVGGVVIEKVISSADGYSVETWTSLDGFDFKVVKCFDGVQHCEDGPAVVVHDDMHDSHVLLFRAYYVRGMLHRTGGPAVEGFFVMGRQLLRNGTAMISLSVMGLLWWLWSMMRKVRLLRSLSFLMVLCVSEKRRGLFWVRRFI